METEYWENDIWGKIEQKQSEGEQYMAIVNNYNRIQKKSSNYQQKQMEIRNQVAILQHDLQESMSNNIDPSIILNDIKHQLFKIQEDLSSRSTKIYDTIKIRVELSNTIKTLESDSSKKDNEIGTLKDSLRLSQEQNAKLLESVQLSEKISSTLQNELLSVREILHNAEARITALESENAAFADRLVTEKQKNIEAMNEMLSLKHLQAKEEFTKQEDNKAPSPEPPTSEQQMSGGIMSILGAFTGVRPRRKSNTTKEGGGGSGNVIKSSESKGVSFGDDDLVENEEGGFVDIRRRMNVSHVPPPRGVVHRLQCHHAEINAITCSSVQFATANANSNVKIFDLNSHEMVRELFCGGGPALSLDVKGKWLLAGCTDNAARLWNMETGDMRHHISGHANKVNSAKLVVSDRQCAITGSADRTLRCWDLTTHHATAISTFKSYSSVEAVGVSPDGGCFASGHHDGGLRLWNLQTNSMTHDIQKLHGARITCVQYDPTSSNFLLTASKDNTLSLIDVRTYQTIKVFRHPHLNIPSYSSQACFSPDGSMIAIGNSDGKLIVWDVCNETPKLTLTGHSSPTISVSWGEKGVVSCDKSGEVILW